MTIKNIDLDSTSQKAVFIRRIVIIYHKKIFIDNSLFYWNIFEKNYLF